MSDHDVIPPSPQHRDEEILQHVLEQVHTGRPLDEVMQDPYVVERQEAGSHARVLDHPEVAKAVGDDIIAEMRQLLANAKEPLVEERAPEADVDPLDALSGDVITEMRSLDED